MSEQQEHGAAAGPPTRGAEKLEADHLLPVEGGRQKAGRTLLPLGAAPLSSLPNGVPLRVNGGTRRSNYGLAFPPFYLSLFLSRKQPRTTQLAARGSHERTHNWTGRRAQKLERKEEEGEKKKEGQQGRKSGREEVEGRETKEGTLRAG